MLIVEELRIPQLLEYRNSRGGKFSQLSDNLLHYYHQSTSCQPLCQLLLLLLSCAVSMDLHAIIHVIIFVS